jgi:hypothetical protein
MLDSKTIKKINDFVYVKPRTIQEIAFLLQKNWRTANSYVEKIGKETGSISTRTFREGTRGALKVVFWNNIERIHSSEFQEKLFRRIELGKTKEDFSPFDIYQYVNENKRAASLESVSDEAKTKIRDFTNTLRSAQSQIMFFSGNVSFINLPYGKKKILDLIEELAKNKISMKILARVELPGIENIKELAAINSRLGKEVIEIRHCEQPLRATIVDSKVAHFKEVKLPEKYKRGELQKKAFIFYEIYDEEWVEWLQKVFWNLFRTAIPASKRVNDLKSIKQALS